MSPSAPRRFGLTKIELLLLFGILLAVIGILAPFVQKVRYAAARSQSQNHLKQMCLALHQMVSPTDAPMPPVVGDYPSGGPHGSFFFHILPSIMSDNVYSTYRNNYKAIETDVVTFLTFCAPSDPTNPGQHTTLTSYASNAAIFGFDRGTVRLSNMTKGRGTANYILIMERFAVVGASGTRHTWPGLGERDNYLYHPDDALDPQKIGSPQFDKAPVDACNRVPHAFSSKETQVGLGDGNVRTIRSDVTRTFTYAEDKTATIWAWACSLDGPLGKAPVPVGW